MQRKGSRNAGLDMNRDVVWATSEKLEAAWMALRRKGRCSEAMKEDVHVDEASDY